MMSPVARLEDYRAKAALAPVPAPPASLPHDAAVEAATLDALINVPLPMADRKAMTAFLTVEHFHVEANRAAYEAVAGVVAEDLPVDAVTVAARLKDRPAPEVPGGWVGYLRDVICDQGGASLESRRHHAKILDNLRRCRAIMLECDTIAAQASKGPSATPLIEEACAKLTGISAQKSGTARSLSDIANDVFTRISSPERRPRTGFRGLDRAIGRLLGGQVTVIPARPKSGKTNLAFHVAENIAAASPDAGELPEASFFVTAEMSAEALYYRQIAIRARVHPDAVQEGTLTAAEWARLTEAAQAWSHLPLVMDDFGGARPTVPAMEAQFQRTRDSLAAGAYRDKFGYQFPRCAMRVMFIDHLGKIASPRDNDPRAGDPQRLKAAMEGVVEMAKRLDCHVFLLWHAGMGDDDPSTDLTVADIRGTKDPEGSCDRILFLTRPEKNRIKLIHFVDRHREAGGSSAPIWLETEAGAIWEAAQ